jgi:hypothetical protein
VTTAPVVAVQNAYYERIGWVLAISRTYNLSTTAERALFALTAYADKDTGECWPGQTTLAADLGVSVGTVKKGLRELLRKTVVTRVPNNRATNTYRLELWETPADAITPPSQEPGVENDPPKRTESTPMGGRSATSKGVENNPLTDLKKTHPSSTHPEEPADRPKQVIRITKDKARDQAEKTSTRTTTVTTSTGTGAVAGDDPSGRRPAPGSGASATRRYVRSMAEEGSQPAERLRRLIDEEFGYMGRTQYLRNGAKLGFDEEEMNDLAELCDLRLVRGRPGYGATEPYEVLYNPEYPEH